MFVVGEPNILLGKWDEFLKFDSINEFFFEIESDWNQEIPNAYVEVILSKSGIEVKRSKTEMFTIDAIEKEETG